MGAGVRAKISTDRIHWLVCVLMCSLRSTLYYLRYACETERLAALAILPQKAFKILRAFGTWTAWRWARSEESVEEEVKVEQGIQ
jgi:hypothetical protein